LTKAEIKEVVRVKVEEHNRTLDVIAKGYEYVHAEDGVMTNIMMNSDDPRKMSHSIGHGSGSQMMQRRNPKIIIIINNNLSGSNLMQRRNPKVIIGERSRNF
jgi:hypothetical protein